MTEANPLGTACPPELALPASASLAGAGAQAARGVHAGPRRAAPSAAPNAAPNAAQNAAQNAATSGERPAPRSPSDVLRGALLDSRERWREFVALASDIAFETDKDGRFTLVTPEQALGWDAEQLIGQPASSLLAVHGRAVFDPFKPRERLSGQRVWLRHADGRMACLKFHVAVLRDETGAVVGARGIGQDVTEQDNSEARAASVLRRGEILEFVLSRMRQEVMAPRMMQAVLEALSCGLGADGAAVVGIAGRDASPIVLHQVPQGYAAVPIATLQQMRSAEGLDSNGHGPDGHSLIACPCETRFGERATLMLWRSNEGRAWDDDDRALVRSASSLVRVALEHEAIQREMARQARTDPLTALLNRRALLDEMARRIDRLDREERPGTLMFIDLDNFKTLNDSRGHEVGDEALCIVAQLLRTAVRPTDLVARLGGDEFAVWMDGCDELAAAERADALCTEGPIAFAHLGSQDGFAMSLSIGIATRWPGELEGLDELIKRADGAMYEVKRNGRGKWHVGRKNR